MDFVQLDTSKNYGSSVKSIFELAKNKDFGEKFIKLSRDVHFLNDNRAKIKLEINNHTGSKIKEIKEYTGYWYLYFFSKYFIKLWTRNVINK